MKFFARKNPDVKANRAAAKKVIVSKAATKALARYEKTFKDLARYDRGEHLSVRVSR